jgi:hypothetical protein
MFAPSLQTSLQRADAFHASIAEEKRHTGAGGFVWSSAIKNDLAVKRNEIIPFAQLLGINV